MKKLLLLLLIFLLSGCSQLGGVANGITQKEITLAGEKVEIGNFNLGAGESKFKPEVKLNKWGDETSIRVWSEEKVEDKATEKDGKVISKTKDGKKEFNFYSTKFEDNDAFEFEIILKEKPKTNVISLKIDLTGIECYYQPELTQQEKDEGSFRPENVISSYACYHESKRGDYSKMGGKNYMAGKAFHIYRPQVEDANGVKVWGKLNIQGNNLTVTIPQDFLDKAVYPVRHAAGLTFGYDTKGATIVTFSAGGIYLNQYGNSGGSVGILSSITAYYKQYKTKTPTIKHALYTDSSNTPNEIVDSTEEWTLTSGWDDWKTLNSINSSAVGINSYWIAWWSKDGEVTMYKDDLGLRRRYLFTTYGDWPSPISTSDGGTSYDYSIYATYTASGGTSYCGHTGGDWYVNSTCWISANTTTPGNVYIGTGGSLNCNNGAIISARSRSVGNGGSYSIGNSGGNCGWSLWTPQ